MPLLLLGLIFVSGLLILYLINTSASSKQKKEDLKHEGNVVFLPKDLEKEKRKHKNL